VIASYSQRKLLLPTGEVACDELLEEFEICFNKMSGNEIKNILDRLPKVGAFLGEMPIIDLLGNIK
jgi:hypothetical protein